MRAHFFPAIAIVILSLRCISMYSRPKDDLIIAVKDQDLQEVSRLLKFNQNLENRNEGHDRTALDWAAYNCDAELAKLLIENRANVNAQSPTYGFSALIIAAQLIGFNQTGCLEVAKILIDAGADVNLLDKKGLPALYYAVSKTKSYEGLKQPGLIELLMQNGAAKTINVRNGLIFAAAMIDAKPETLRLLISYNIDPTIAAKYIPADCKEKYSALAANPFCEENKQIVKDYVAKRAVQK